MGVEGGGCVMVVPSSSSVVHVAQQNPNHTSSSPSPPLITVTHAALDSHANRFSTPHHWHIPLTGELELLAGGVVENGQLGHFGPHLAIRRGGDLVVGVLDLAQECFHSLVEMALPVHHDVPESIPCVKECWITDGPAVVAFCENDLLIAWYQSSYCDAPESVKRVAEDSWNAYLLHLKDFGDILQVRTIYCGDLKNFAEPELILSIQNLSIEPFERSNNEWAYVSLPLHTFPFSEKHPGHPADSTSKLCWLTLPCSYVLHSCEGLFPPNIDPSHIACAEFVPANPSTISLSIWPYENVELTTVPNDLILALLDGKLLKAKHGCISAEVKLNDAPMSIQFAVVAGGQGILLANFVGIQNKVVALCADSLEQLQVWTGVQEAVVGDLQMLGHDQIILLLIPEFEAHDLAKNNNKEYFHSVQITDLVNNIYAGTEQCQMLNCAGIATDNHRVHSLNSFSQSLQLRLKAGLAEMNQLKKKREAKIELLHSSCELMQSMVTQHEVSPAICKNVSGLSQKSETLLLSRKSRYVRDVAFEQGTCGRTWFLIADFQSDVPRGIVLQNISLLLASIQGKLDGICSTLDSACSGEGRKQLIMAVPSKNLPIFSCFPLINVIMSAEVLINDDSTDLSTESIIHDFRKGKRICWLHTEWLGQIQVDSMSLTRSYEPEMVPIIFREVAPKEMFVMRSKTESEMKFLDIFLTAVQMKLRQNQFQKSHDMAHELELVASNCLLWADATVVSLDNVHAVTLRAEDFHHFLAVKACLLANLENHILLVFFCA